MKSLVQMGNWVLCRVFLKKRSTKNDNEINQDSKSDRSVEVAMPNFYDSKMRDLTLLLLLLPVLSLRSLLVDLIMKKLAARFLFLFLSPFYYKASKTQESSGCFL